MHLIRVKIAHEKIEFNSIKIKNSSARAAAELSKCSKKGRRRLLIHFLAAAAAAIIFLLLRGKRREKFA